MRMGGSAIGILPIPPILPILPILPIPATEIR